LLDRPRLSPIAATERVRPRAPTVVVVGPLGDDSIAAQLAEAFASVSRRVTRTRLLVREKPGFDLANGAGACHPDALLDATRALLASLPAHDVLLAEGAPLLAAIEPTLAILGARSPSLLTLEPEVRTLRERFDLVLYDTRPVVLDHIAHTFRA
jgi:hypothetical protein